MGLHVSSIAELGGINTGLEKIDYYIYFLNYYQFADEVVDAFLRELPELETHLANIGNAVIITSVKNQDFYSETLNWHNICGIDPVEFGPALLLCTLPPSHFGPEPQPLNGEFEPWVLLPLNQLCETESDLIGLLRRIVSSIKNKSPLSDFQLDTISNYKNRPIISGKKLSYLGIELNLEEVFRKAKTGVKKIKRPRLPK